jgi:tryptophan-rich sensory protein
VPFDVDLPRLALVVGWTVAMAILGTVLAGDAVRTWYPSLRKTRIEIPLTLFALVGGVTYIAEAIVGYRLLERLGTTPSAGLVLVALVVVMLYNECWNAALFRLRSPFAALVALFGFLAPLVILLIGCVLVDLPSAVLIGAYALWVVCYDIPWMYGLWRLNGGATSGPIAAPLPASEPD